MQQSFVEWRRTKNFKRNTNRYFHRGGKSCNRDMQFWTCSPGIFCKKRCVVALHVVNRWYASSLFVRVAHARIPPPYLARSTENAVTGFRILSRNRWNSARSNPGNAWNPVNVLNRSRGISKLGPTEECQFLIDRCASRPLCRVCDRVARVLNSLSSRPSFKSAWNSRGGEGGRFDRRTIHDKLVSRLEESLVNSSHPENCFQMLYRV